MVYYFVNTCLHGNLVSMSEQFTIMKVELLVADWHNLSYVAHHCKQNDILSSNVYIGLNRGALPPSTRFIHTTPKLSIFTPIFIFISPQKLYALHFRVCHTYSDPLSLPYRNTETKSCLVFWVEL